MGSSPSTELTWSSTSGEYLPHGRIYVERDRRRAAGPVHDKEADVNADAASADLEQYQSADGAASPYLTMAGAAGAWTWLDV